MRNIYKVLASQYNPLGFILPYTTRAKVIIRHLWDKQRGWDDPHLPQELMQQWTAWEEELQFLPEITLPRPYVPKEVDTFGCQREVHIFCDASEEAYGSVAYLRTTGRNGEVHLAVHLDVLNTIDADAFLMALRRFVARKGTPAELFSDQGTNFRGGERELCETFLKMAPELQQLLAPQKISFRFNPPGAPHFGGAWERKIRAVKYALYATVGAQSVPEEVLRTVLIEVEGILNSKPLGYVSSDARDADPVTPNVLLMGRPDGSLPQIVYPENELLSRRRWQHSQVLADHFWSRFIRQYILSLQTRQKWQTTAADLAEDSVVMIADPQLPRALWPVGRVIKTHPSPDGRIRSADVKVKERVYTRPVARLVALPALPSGEDEDSSASNSPQP
ncbi:solute carrier family 15, member 5 [Sarotherodon galilaeus]